MAVIHDRAACAFWPFSTRRRGHGASRRKSRWLGWLRSPITAPIASATSIEQLQSLARPHACAFPPTTSPNSIARARLEAAAESSTNGLILCRRKPSLPRPSEREPGRRRLLHR